MKPDCNRLQAIAGSVLLAALLPAPAHAAPVYSQTIIDPLATVSTLDDFTNCRDNEGCLGKTGQVFDAAGNALAVGNLTDTILYTFTLTQADIDAINANPGGTATLSMTAARDLGLRAGSATNTDYLVTSVDGTLVGNLFGTTVSTCPAGENFNPINFACGPNYHNDVTADSSLDFLDSLFMAAAADGSIGVLVNPTDDVGRLKVFSVTLQYTSSVPEGSSLWLLAIAMSGLAVARRNKAPAAR
jgi:hypothetical protein